MKLAIILGGAENVWDELAKARDLIGDQPYAMIATNHAARDFDGPVDHWVTHHPELLPGWRDARERAGRSPAGHYWTTDHRVSPIPIERIKTRGGSSGLLSVYVGLHLGYDRMQLCGVPMCQNGRHYDNPRKWVEARQYWSAWTRAMPEISDKVRSWGGETLKMLGPPNKGWLDGTDRNRTRQTSRIAGTDR